MISSPIKRKKIRKKEAYYKVIFFVRNYTVYAWKDNFVKYGPIITITSLYLTQDYCIRNYVYWGEILKASLHRTIPCLQLLQFYFYFVK